MNRPRSLRHLNYSHALLISGLVLSLLVVMFRPSGAEADLPTSVDVFDSAGAEQDGAPATVPLKGLPEIGNVDYNVILRGQKKGTEVGLSGVPLIEFLKAGGVKTENVQFVKIRYGTTNDGLISLIPLNQADTERPPIILGSGKAPGRGPFDTPAIVPGQPDLSKAISEESFAPFSTKGPRLKLVPGAPGAKIMSVKITSKKRKNGEYTFSAKVSGGGSGAKEYQWYTYDSKGKPVVGQTGPSMETNNATTGSSEHDVSVVVTERGTGSTGAAAVEYTSRKKTKGATKNPYPDPTPTTGSNTGTGTGTGAGTGFGGGAVNTLPNTSPTPAPPSSTQSTVPEPSAPTTTAPTESTSTATIDTSAITNVAQNVSGTGGLQTVTGVLLSSPTTAPIGEAGGGSAITALPPAVADQINSIFQPVDDVGDAWVYLLALLFAFTFSGAVREWVKP